MIKKAIVVLFILFCCLSNSSCKKDDDVNLFSIVEGGEVTPFYISSGADSLVVWAVHELADDIEEITGVKPSISITENFDEQGIYFGEVKSNLFNAVSFSDSLSNKWETFAIKNEQNNLLVVGSDVRGTVYAVFEIAEQLGISPWQWWADVKNIKKESLQLKLPENGIFQSPSVQYRGIFLNDEDWGLQPWAAKTFEPETGDIGPKTYEKIFQLLLRLKANTIWPAMHPCTKGFFTVNGNKEIAQKYKIIIGSSHAEPMLRNNVDEWDYDVYGDYNYFTNSEKVNLYWQERLNEINNANNETILTLGMRGIHDSKMQGAKNTEETVAIIEDIITTQRQMLVNTFDKPLNEIPQAFIPYKEVLELYDAGLKVPEDITLIWPDDNYGYIRRLSNEEEQKRAGGAGVYYHLSYWGRPHDYLWLSTTQPGLIWFEMMKAYENGAKKIWIANVGDIKPAEYNTELFLDLAWNVNSIGEHGLNDYLKKWISREFTPEIQDDLAVVFEEYYRLAFLRKPEYMGWSQTERTTPVKQSDFSKIELENRIAAYAALVNKVDDLSSKIPEDRKDAWFQLVEYPVKGAAYMNHKFGYWNLTAFSKNDTEVDGLEKLSSDAYVKIKNLTEAYNTQIAGGKWNNMMSMNPRGLPVFDSLKKNETKAENKTAYKINRIHIQAKDYKKSEGFNSYKWSTINGLGYSNDAITLFPLKHSYFETEKPYLLYEFNVDNAGDYELELRFLPTHANNFDHQVNVQLNNDEEKLFKLNTQGRSAGWKENVLRNSTSKKVSFTASKKGRQILKISVNQTGIVLDQLSIYPKSSGSTYVIPVNK